MTTDAPKTSESSPPKRRLLHQWQTWHTYATYLNGLGRIDGDWVAERLVSDGIAELVFARPGQVWFPRGRRVARATLDLAKTPFEATATITFPKGMSEYAMECAFQAASMETQERHLVSDPRGFMPEYLRVFLPPCQLIAEAYGYAVYPQVKLYANGVMLTHLRVLSGDKALDVQEFIERHVNLFMVVGKDLRVHLGVFLPYISSLLLGGPLGFRQRREALKTLSAVYAWAALTASQSKEELGSWPLLSLSDFPSVEAGENAVPRTLRHVARMIETAILSTLEAQRKGRGYLLFGGSKGQPSLGSFWSGRPSVHLVRFEDQPATSAALDDGLRADLAQVMFKSVAPLTGNAEAILGPNTRAFDDFLVYQSRGMTLWVSTAADLAPGRAFPEDPNQNYLVLARQVQVEVVDYLHMAARRLHERALEGGRAGDLLNDERELVVLEQGITEVSLMGEVQDFVRQGCGCSDVDGLRERTRAALNLKSAEIAERRNTLAARFGSLLTIVFGLMGAPAVQAGITDPLLRMLGWSLPGSQDAQIILGFGIACGVVIGLVLLAYGLLRWLGRRRE